MEKTPFISIIIPVYNDTSRLKRCIKALEEQTYPKGCYEIVVVDNGSKDNLSEIKSFENLRLEFETKSSQFAARNKGVSISRGKILAFTDSDCIPSPRWIEGGVKAILDQHNCGIVGGAVNFFFKANKPNLIELYDSLFFLQQKRYVEEIKFAVTANLFTFKDVFNKVGLFNENLRSGGDGEWGKRVFAQGYNIIYSADAIVNHPARHKLSELYKKIKRVTGGKFLREKRAGESFVRFWKVNFLEFSFGINRVLKLKNVTLHRKTGLFILELSIQLLRMYELARLKYGKIPERQ